MNEIYYEEVQKYNQFILRLIIVIGASVPIAVFGYGYIQQVFLGIPFGDVPTSDTVLLLSVLISLFFAFVLLGLFFGSNLKTIVKDDGIYLRYFPFHLKYKKFEMKDIKEFYVRKYSPILEYGGWGIRFGFSPRGMAYNVHGNMGIQLIFEDGRKILIGTQKPDEFLIALKKIKK